MPLDEPHTAAMFATRLAWDQTANPLARLCEAKQNAGVPILDLTGSNPTTAGIDYPAAIAHALGHPRALTYRPDPLGPIEARQAIVNYYQTRGQAIDPARLVLTASTSEAYAWLFKLLCMPGDAVAVPKPSYPLFDFLADLECVRLLPYYLGFDGSWHWDIAELATALAQASDRVRAVLMVNPNNPTGNILHPDERRQFCQLAAECHLPLIVDEVFSDYSLIPDAPPIASMVDEKRGLTFCLNGFSKVLGLPQLKLAWIYVAGPEQLAKSAHERLTLIADTYLSVSTPVALAAGELLAWQPLVGGAISARTRANLDLLRRAFKDSCASLLPVAGGWYATLALPRIRSDESWALEFLQQDNVLCQPGYFYDDPIEAHLVLSLLTPPAVLQQGIERIVQRLSIVDSLP